MALTPQPSARLAVAAACGLAAAAAVAVALLRDRAPDAAETAVLAPAAPAAMAPTPPAAAPTLDLLRTEPDGATSVAGRAEPGAEVTIRAGDEALAVVRADGTGAFVANFRIGPDTPREATVEAVAEGGAPTRLAVALAGPKDGFLPAAGGATAEAQADAGAPADPDAEAAPKTDGAPSIPIETAAAAPVDPAAAPTPATPTAAPTAAPTPVAVAESPAAPSPAPAAPASSAPAGSAADAEGPAAPAPAGPAPTPRPIVALAPAPPAALQGATVVVAPGATLWALARAHYGAGRRYPAIVSANPGEIADPALIFPGQRLYLPPPAAID